jgi:hypothetical protein
VIAAESFEGARWSRHSLMRAVSRMSVESAAVEESVSLESAYLSVLLGPLRCAVGVSRRGSWSERKLCKSKVRELQNSLSALIQA